MVTWKTPLSLSVFPKLFIFDCFFCFFPLFSIHCLILIDNTGYGSGIREKSIIILRKERTQLREIKTDIISCWSWPNAGILGEVNKTAVQNYIHDITFNRSNEANNLGFKLTHPCNLSIWLVYLSTQIVYAIFSVWKMKNWINIRRFFQWKFFFFFLILNWLVKSAIKIFRSGRCSWLAFSRNSAVISPTPPFFYSKNKLLLLLLPTIYVANHVKRI